MSQVLDKKLKETFRQQLLVTAQELLSDSAVLKSNTVVQPLATLTKLVVRHRETIRALKLSSPAVVIILTGSKVLYANGQSQTFVAGDLFVMPPHITFDVINQPTAHGEYIALILELSNDLLERVRKAYPEIANAQSTHSIANDFSITDFRISLLSSLADALLHLVRGITHAQTTMLNQHRLMEVVLLLLQSNARNLLLQSIYPDFSTHLRSLISNDLAYDWTLERLAQKLDISVSTLKRRLQSANLSYRQLLDEARMQKAMELLEQGHQNVAQVALACGYQSQSRFATRFRKYYQLNPSDVLSGRVDPIH
ncbi:MAG: helix-turn-helix domain-containing protein [Cyanobacteria bacterium P01_F01_bin.13]